MAPKVNGECGTAVIPIPTQDDELGTVLSYKPWSELVSDHVLTCFADDARVSVC